MPSSKLEFPYPTTNYLAPVDGDYKLGSTPTEPPKNVDSKKKLKEQLAKEIDVLSEQQRRLYAENTHSVLAVFQAMDAAGKDSTIRSVFSGVNPAGFQVYSFKKPSDEALDHDFLWRTTKRLPERGRIGVFNRSYYEELLVVRVHPELLTYQNLPTRKPKPDSKEFWSQRFESIREHEQHLYRNGTIILKFWLNVSKTEQANRFISRLEEPHKHWKFSDKDLEEREYWEDYQECYEDIMQETSRPWAPWYVVPADSKPFMRLEVAKTIVETLKTLDPKYPEVDAEKSANFDILKAQLEKELD
jgi:PPK2 family polyphosphate:nucleotide phosphotransferase